MHIKDTLLNFLYDKDYFISMYDKYVHVFNYKKLVYIKEDVIKLDMEDFSVLIKGSSLFIVKMAKNEILIKGSIQGLSKVYER